MKILKFKIFWRRGLYLNLHILRKDMVTVYVRGIDFDGTVFNIWSSKRKIKCTPEQQRVWLTENGSIYTPLPLTDITARILSFGESEEGEEE